MKTSINIKTWSCVACDYHQDFEPTYELMSKYFEKSDDFCPSCGKVQLTKETNPDKKTNIVVMGEEDIEPEIVKDDEEKEKAGKTKMTNTEKQAYRDKRKADIVEAIAKAKEMEDK